MAQFGFAEEDTALPDLKSVQRWQHWVKTQIRVGIELEKEGLLHNPQPSARRDAGFYPSDRDFINTLSPSGTYDRLTEYNVVNVTHDASVHGSGTEVLICGTNEAFGVAHDKMAKLHEIMGEWGLKAGVSAGMHYHLIASQNDMCPVVIIKNLFQMMRRYFPALLYLCATTPRTVLRDPTMNFFNARHMELTPVGRAMESLKESIYGRYCSFNMGTTDGGRKDLTRFTYLNGKEYVSTFHVEFRFPDSSDSAGQITAQSYLFRAMLMKSVELSRFGVMVVDADRDEWARIKNAARDIQTLGTGAREALAFAKAQSKELLDFLRGSLMSVDGSSIPVLETMVDSPVWQMRDDRKTWRQVERHLMPRERVLNEDAERVLRSIMLQQVTGVETIKAWKTACAEYLGIPRPRVLSALKKLRHQLNLVFDRELGTFLAAW